MAFLIGIISMVILIMEVFYTRLFSVLFWHHMAFAVVSLALMGISASGLLVYLMPDWFKREKIIRQIAWLVPAFALSLPVFSSMLIRFPMSTMGVYNVSIFYFVPVIAMALIPFFLGGLIISLILTNFSENVSKLYFWDLCGASVGALSALFLLGLSNGPDIVVWLALAVCFSGVIFSWRYKQKSGTMICIGVALISLLYSQHETSQTSLKIQYSKGALEGPASYEQWDPVARVRVLKHPNSSFYFQIDSGVITPILEFDGTIEHVEYLKHNILQLAYLLGPYKKCVIIGPGGGSDVLSALSFGNKDITAVEINRSIVDLMKNELVPLNGGIYNSPNVQVKVGEGRAFLANMKDKADLIQATFIDTFAAASSGSHTLSENYLYTTDAIEDYLNHLTPDGLVSISRFGGGIWGYSEVYRVVGIAERALRERGIKDPRQHIVVVQGPPTDIPGGGYQAYGTTDSMTTILVRNASFTLQQIERLEKSVKENSFRPLWIPRTQHSEATLKTLFDSQGNKKFYKDYYKTYGLDISPVSDDQPFFFDMLKPVDFYAMSKRFAWMVDTSYFIRYVGIYIIYQVFFALALFAALIIGLPLFLGKNEMGQLEETKYFLIYFIALGVGFMGIELGLIQRFSLFLGHPVYSLVVVLAALLMFSGLGSLASAKLDNTPQRHASTVSGILVAVLAIYGLALPYTLKSLIALPFEIKTVITTAIIFPPAFLMGMLFPLGIKSLGKEFASLIPWMWGLNSGFSILASIISLYVSMTWGFEASWCLFTLVYLVAGYSSNQFIQEKRLTDPALNLSL